MKEKVSKAKTHNQRRTVNYTVLPWMDLNLQYAYICTCGYNSNSFITPVQWRRVRAEWPGSPFCVSHSSWLQLLAWLRAEPVAWSASGLGLRSSASGNRRNGGRGGAPKAVTFPTTKELPRVGFEPTTLRTGTCTMYELTFTPLCSSLKTGSTRTESGTSSINPVTACTLTGRLTSLRALR